MWNNMKGPPARDEDVMPGQQALGADSLRTRGAATPPVQPPHQLLPEPAVRVVYAVPADRPVNAAYRQGISNALTDLQRWYREQLDGLTFRLQDPLPETCTMPEPHEHYTHGGWPRVWNEVRDAVIGCGFLDQQSAYTWVVYADVDESCDVTLGLGRGTEGLTMMGSWDLKGLTDPEWVHCGLGPFGFGRWIGGAGHELGHAFGLDHPVDDEGALMSAGYAGYPNTYLREDEKAILRMSPFFEER